MVQDKQMLPIYNKTRDFITEQVKNGDKPHELAVMVLLVHEYMYSHQEQVVQGLMELMKDEVDRAHHQQVSMTKIKWIMSTIEWIEQNNK